MCVCSYVYDVSLSLVCDQTLDPGLLFRFPTKRLSAQKKEVPNKRQPVRAAHPERRATERTRLKRGVAEVASGRVSAREAGKRLPERKEEEDDEEEDSDKVKMDICPQVLSKRDKNIQENKDMVQPASHTHTHVIHLSNPKCKNNPTKFRLFFGFLLGHSLEHWTPSASPLIHPDIHQVNCYLGLTVIVWLCSSWPSCLLT